MKKIILLIALFITSLAFAQLPPANFPDGVQTNVVQLDSLTTAQRDALTVFKGAIVFNTTTSQLENYNGTVWGAIGGGSGTIAIPNREMAYGNATGDSLTSHTNIQAYGSSGWIKLNDGGLNTSNLYANRLESRNSNDYSALFYNLLRHYNTTDGSMYVRPSAGYTDGVTLFYPPLTANDTIATLSDITGSGGVERLGTPIDNQIAIWSGTNVIEGTADLKVNLSNKQNLLTIGTDGVNAGAINLAGSDGVSSVGVLRFYNNSNVDTNADYFGLGTIFGFGDFGIGTNTANALLIDDVTLGLTVPSTSIADIDLLGAKSLITKEYGDANYSGGSDVFQVYADSPVQPIAWVGTQAQFDAKFNVTDYPSGVPAEAFSIVTDGTPTVLTASDIVNVPSGNLAGINVQLALDELQTEVDGVSIGDYSEWASYTGTVLGVDLLTTLGGVTKIQIDELNEEIRLGNPVSNIGITVDTDTNAPIGERGIILNGGTGSININPSNFGTRFFTNDNAFATTIGYGFGASGLTDNRVLSFPDASGTLALEGGLGDSSEWASYTGTRLGGDLITTIGDYDGLNNGTTIQIDDANDAVNINRNLILTGAAIGITFTNNLTNTGTIFPHDGTLTANRSYDLPDASGTIALTSDIVSLAYSETFGNGVLTTIPITHNLGTEDIASVRIVDVATKETIQTTQIGVDANTINLIFATAPTTNQYRVTIKK